MTTPADNPQKFPDDFPELEGTDFSKLPQPPTVDDLMSGDAPTGGEPPSLEQETAGTPASPDDPPSPGKRQESLTALEVASGGGSTNALLANIFSELTRIREILEREFR